MTPAIDSDVETSGLPDTLAPPDPKRRKLLTAATGIVGGAGVAAASIPFVESMLPSERARAAGAPVEAAFAGLEPGQQLSVEWRGKPVWILRRSEAMLRTLRDRGINSNLQTLTRKSRASSPHMPAMSSVR